MEKKQFWIDVLIIFGMILLVYIFCQPVGRKWNEVEKKVYTGEEGVYSFDPDSYYYLRRAKEFTQNGFSSIRLIYSRTEDSMVTSTPSEGTDFFPNLLSVLAAVVWYALRGLGLDVSIYQIGTHLNSVLLSLFTVPIYLFLKKRISRLASVFGALMGALAAPYFRHSCEGSFDTDAIIGLLALIIVLSLYDCVLSKDKTKQIVYGVLSCLALGLLYLSWTAFFIYGFIAVGTASMGLIVERIVSRQSKDQRRSVYVPILFLCIVALISVALGAKTFISIIKGFMTSETVGVGAWPSANMFVSELQRPAFASPSSFWYIFCEVGADYLSYFGGALEFVALCASCGYFGFWGIRKICKREIWKVEEGFLFASLGTWLLGTVVMLFFGIRFMEFVILPVSIIIAFGFARAEDIIKKQGSQFVLRVAFVVIAIMAFCVSITALPMIAVILAIIILLSGFFLAKMRNKYPAIIALFVVLVGMHLLNDWLITSLQNRLIERPVEDAMIWLRENTPEDAVIADYWSLGYPYQYYSERRTISDGGTFNGEYFYWLATMLTTDDVKLSAGIARMIQSGGMEGSRIASELFDGNREAVVVLKKILPMSREEALSSLRDMDGLLEEEIESLLSYTHPSECPDIYFVASFEMLRGLSALSYYRDWDFSGETTEKGFSLMGSLSMEKPNPGETIGFMLRSSRAETDWVAFVSTEEDGSITGWLKSPDGQELDCNRVIYIKDREIVSDIRKTIATEERGVINEEALVILEENGLVSTMVCERYMPDSLFFRLYILDGKGQDTFEKVFEAELPEELTGEKSRIQRWIGTIDTKSAASCGISLWKVKH